MVFDFLLSIRSLHEFSVWFTLKKYCTLWLIQNWLTRNSTNKINQLKIFCRYRNKNGSNHRISHWLLKRAEFKIQKTCFIFIQRKFSKSSENLFLKGSNHFLRGSSGSNSNFIKSLGKTPWKQRSISNLILMFPIE